MADPVTIAQTGVDPATGSYLSAERRKAIFKSTRVSGFSGGGGGNVEPQTSAIVKRQANEIVQLKKEINTIQKAQTAAATTFQQTISGIQSFLGVIGVNVRDLGGRILGVNNLLAADANLEARKDRQELAQEKKLAEQGARAGKEKLLEQRIQNAMMAPIKMVTAKTQGIFQRLMQAFTFFFLGWLTNKVIATLQDKSGQAENIFKRIFDSIIGGVMFFVRTLQFINRTISGIVRIVFTITKTISKFLASGLVKLFQGISKLAQGVVNAGKNLLGLGPKAAQTATEAATNVVTKAGTEVAEAGAEAGLRTAGREGAERGAARLLGRFAPGANVVLGGASAAMNFSQGDVVGGLLDVGSMVPGPIGWAFLAGSLGWEVNQGMRENKNTPAQGPTQRAGQTPPTQRQRPAAASVAPSPTPASQPLSPAIPPPASSQPTPQLEPQKTNVQPTAPTVLSASDFQFGVDTSGTMEMDFDKPAQYGESTAPVIEGSTSTSETRQQAQITPAETQRVPKPAARVGPEPEQKPNVVMMSSITPQSQASSTILKSSPGNAASDVPAIPSANPSNFYTLYSQVNYNVVV